MERDIVVQGRHLGPEELSWLAQWIEDHRQWSRKRLARQLCEHWNWRDQRGRIKDFAARSLLLKLEAQGNLRLPPLQVWKRRAPRAVPKLAHWQPPELWEASLAQIRPVRLEPVCAGSPPAGRWAFYLDQYHYLGLRVVGQNMGYLAVDAYGREVAVLLFGAPAGRCAPRDQFLGWDDCLCRQQLHRLANNTRFLILPWVRVPHLASHPDWGAGPRKKDPQRILWHEIKSAVIYRLERRGTNGSGRGMLVEKFVVATPPETSPVDFGAAVQAEARRRGLGRAQYVYLVMDGAVWLWGLAEDRFAQAIKTLDFHHARDHLWVLAHTLHGEGTPEAKAWVEPLLRSLRKGREAYVVRQLEELLENQPARTLQSQEVVEREVKFFAKRRDHLHLPSHGENRRSPWQWCCRVTGQAVTASNAGLWPNLGPTRFHPVAQGCGARQKSR